MKKILLFSLVFTCFFSYAQQTLVDITAPASLTGSLEHGIALNTAGWTVMPDMFDPINSVHDTLVFVDDGTAGDSLGCNALVNGPALAGNIAVVYRGSCQFGTKALNAQNQGAVGIIIINNIADPPFDPGAGTDGPSVSIPTVMISQADGAALRDSILGGIVTAYIGSNLGYYSDDVATTNADVLRPENASTPRQIAQSAADFSVDMGARVYNYGTNDQSDVVLTATIEYGGSVIYSQSSAPQSILSGDTAFIALPTFSQSTYGVGYYSVSYIVSMGATDENLNNNVIRADFQISDDLLSLGQLDSTMAPEPGVFFRAVNSGGNTDYISCLHFMNPNASRLAVDGMWWAATGNGADGMNGVYTQLFVYEWLDVFTDLNDAAYDNVNLTLNEIGSGEYDYLSDLSDEFVYAPITATGGGQVTLNDNQRYLFCVSIQVDSVFLSHDDDADYTINRDYYLQPLAPIQADLSWNANGFGAEPVPSTAVQVSGVNAIAEDYEAPFEAYPNPSSDIVSFKVGDAQITSLSILDITGNLVKTRALNNNGLSSFAIDVSDLASGQYIFSFLQENGDISNVKVTIAK